MIITIDVGGLAEFLVLGKVPGGDDVERVIGLSAVAYLSKKDPAHRLMPAALWHDAAFQKGASIQSEWPMWKVNSHFLKMMIDIINADNEKLSRDERIALEQEACVLYLLCEKYGDAAWEGL